MNNALLRSIFFFILAALLEIGGGYLMWLWLRERWAWWVGGARSVYHHLVRRRADVAAC
jgi:small multidrug resistance family-3 protein